MEELITNRQLLKHYHYYYHNYKLLRFASFGLVDAFLQYISINKINIFKKKYFYFKTNKLRTEFISLFLLLIIHKNFKHEDFHKLSNIYFYDIYHFLIYKGSFKEIIDVFKKYNYIIESRTFLQKLLVSYIVFEDKQASLSDIIDAIEYFNFDISTFNSEGKTIFHYIIPSITDYSRYILFKTLLDTYHINPFTFKNIFDQSIIDMIKNITIKNLIKIDYCIFNNKQINPTEICPICLELFNDNNIFITNCNHYFHKECILQTKLIECPMCRSKEFI